VSPALSPALSAVRQAVGPGLADGLCLAATPTFAVMALVSATLGDPALNLLCAAAQEASPLGGMVPMYALMSVFHAAPWLRLVPNRARL
jgi:hypothetical protein